MESRGCSYSLDAADGAIVLSCLGPIEQNPSGFLGFRAQGLGLGFRVWGSGFSACLARILKIISSRDSVLWGSSAPNPRSSIYKDPYPTVGLGPLKSYTKLHYP